MTGACQSLWKIMHAQHLESCLLVKGSCKIKIVQPLINIWLDKLFNLVGNYLWGWTLGSEVYSWQYVPLLTVCPFADSMPLCWQYVPLLTVCPFADSMYRQYHHSLVIYNKGSWERLLDALLKSKRYQNVLQQIILTGKYEWVKWMNIVHVYDPAVYRIGIYRIGNLDFCWSAYP